MKVWVYSCQKCDVSGFINDAVLSRLYQDGVVPCPRCQGQMERIREAKTGEYRQDEQEALAIHAKSKGLAPLALSIDFTGDEPVYRWRSPFQDATLQSGTPDLVDLHDDTLITGREAAKLLGLSYNLFNEKVRNGEIAYEEHDGRSRRYRVRDLRAYIESKVVKARTTQSKSPDHSLPVKKDRKKKKSMSDWRREMKDW